MPLFPGASRTVVLATGGTIAGTADSPDDDTGYTAAQLGIAPLLATVPCLAGLPIDSEQVAQIDSKDMSHAIWQTLALRVAHHLARPDVVGIVITHGTDTLEETAYFLHRVLAPVKPVVLTGAMRPATSARADGPRNVFDAVTVAREAAAAGLSGVMAVLNGTVHSALQVRKRHPNRLDAFDSGDAGPLGTVEAGRLTRANSAAPPAEAEAIAPGAAAQTAPLTAAVADWPRVEIVFSHAGASGAVVTALCAQGVDGLIVAATGNGTLHHDLEAALLVAQANGIAVLRSPRCGDGRLPTGPGQSLAHAGELSPVKARIELMLQLMQRQQP